MRKTSLLLFVLVLCFSCSLTAFAASREEIIGKWRELRPVYYDEPYAEAPSTSHPYKAGELKAAFLRDAGNYLNFMRFLAGLPETEIKASLNEEAQAGALLLASSNFSHTPQKPQDMDDAFYKNAYAVTSTSNISSGYYNIYSSIQGCMDDTGTNLPELGHRRWFLNPSLKYVGFGYAEYYSVVRVTDTSGDKFDYNFITWPAAGDFPDNVFDPDIPWSVILNPEKYGTPSIDEVKVTLTETATGKTKTFTKNDNHNNLTSTQAYFNVETKWYGVPNCIIFKPDEEQFGNFLGELSGEYRVSVSGVKDIAGNEAKIEYTVNFFNMGDGLLARYSDRDLMNVEQKIAIGEMLVSEVIKGYPDGTIGPENSITRAEFTAMIVRYMGYETDPGAKSVFSDVPDDYWAKEYINAAYQMKAVDGVGNNMFAPEDPVTCEQAAKIITILRGFSKVIDVEKNGGYPEAYFYFAQAIDLCENQIVVEMGAPLSRIDAAVMIYNASDTIKVWTEYKVDRLYIWHVDRQGRGIGYRTNLIPAANN